MLSAKRKHPSSMLERRLRPRKDEESEAEFESDGLDESGSDPDDDQSDEAGSDNDEDKEDEDGSDVSEDETEEGRTGKPQANLAAVSFGDLARAQASLPPSELRRKKKRAPAAAEAKSASGSESDSAPESHPAGGAGAKASSSKPGRQSKHAPTEMSSKRAVTRRREVVSVPGRRVARDPRFDAAVAGGSHLDEAKARKAYAFLDEYRAGEEGGLRKAIRKEKNQGKKEELQRQLMSMESRRKDRERKDREKKILDEHRRQEKELVEQGKKPFYLKRAEQKRRVLVEKFKGMRKKQVDRAIERKRKKEVVKEKRELEGLTRRQ